MKIQSALIKVKKSNILKKIIIILFIFIFLSILLIWGYSTRYFFSVNSIRTERAIFLGDYMLFYEIIERLRNR